MSQHQKLEQVLDLLLSEDSEQAAELLHQIIVEKARTIYESIVDEEADVEEEDTEETEDEVGGDPDKDFTADIEDKQTEIDTDQENDGEAGSDDEDEESEDEPEGDVEERVEDLEDQLAELRAEFDALMGEEMQEPNHADLSAEMGEIEDEFGGEDEFAAAGDDMGAPDFSGEEQVVGEVVARMAETKAAQKLAVAPQTKKMPKGKSVAEETQFLTKVADTGQTGTAKLVGTGKNTPLGAENDKSPYTNIPARKDYGGKPAKIGGGTGGEYGKYHGDSAKDDTPTDNVDVKPKNSSVKADTTAKYTGGKAAGEGFTKSPLTKKPQ